MCIFFDFQRQQTANITSLVLSNERRIRWVNDVCKRHSALMTSRTHGHIWASPRYALAFCVVPKVGCTYWKRLL